MHDRLPEPFLEAAQRFPDRPAILRDGPAITYAELAADVDRFAGALAQLGLGGRRLGVLLPNLAGVPQVLYGIVRAGGSALLLNPANSPREVREYLEDARVDTVVTVAPLLPLLPRGVRALRVEDLPRAATLDCDAEPRTVVLAHAAPPPPMSSDGGGEAAVLYTAATGGWARGAVLTHRNLIANLRSTAEALRLDSEDRCIAALPWIHAFGLTVGLNAPLAAGSSVLPVERFHPLRMLELFGSSGATVFSGVPAMYIALLAGAERRAPAEHALRVTLAGGAALPVEVQHAWERRFGVPLRQGYGLTEAAPVCLFNRVDRPNRPGTLGQPLPAVEVTIRGPDGRELPPGEVGEICIRGENVFPGYLGDQGRRAGDFFDGEWLRTGDLGSAQEDGVVRFRGLLKPMFTRNGFNVYPREVERALRADSRVAAARVESVPDPARENDVVLHLTPAAGASLTEDEVAEICRARLAAYKQPSRIFIESGAAARDAGGANPSH